MASDTVKNSLDQVQCVSESSDSDLLQYKDKLAVQAKLPVCGSTQATGAQQVYALNLLQRTGKDPLRAGSYLLC